MIHLHSEARMVAPRGVVASTTECWAAGLSVRFWVGAAKVRMEAAAAAAAEAEARSGTTVAEKVAAGHLRTRSTYRSGRSLATDKLHTCKQKTLQADWQTTSMRKPLHMATSRSFPCPEGNGADQCCSRCTASASIRAHQAAVNGLVRPTKSKTSSLCMARRAVVPSFAQAGA